jgi:general secretion pathway protein E
MIQLEQIRQAQAVSLTNKLPWDQVLCQSLGCDAIHLLEDLGASFGYPVIQLSAQPALEFNTDMLDLSLARKMMALVLKQSEDHVLVFADPADERLQAWADCHGIATSSRFLVLESELAANISRLDADSLALDGVIDSSFNVQVSADQVEEISLTGIDETSSPVIRLINSTLFDAMGAGASDIHLEAAKDGLVVKYRVDGVIIEVARVPGVVLNDQAISRVKVIAELDITERRIPQDGRFKVKIRGREIDFRVSIMPSVFGEDAVIRVLDKEHLSQQSNGLTLNYLGFDEATKSIIRSLSAQPYGMLLITGPTGSGKTTTLYAAISEGNDGRSKIITIEDPVEYQMAGVLQIPVNEKKGLNFAKGLRSILRHDPDKIMVGEIRDGETAQIAVQAALTGHLVYSTVHANNVFDVLGRFEHMQVEPYMFVAALNGIVAQRLVRVFCPQCHGAGCPHCRHTGFKGRCAIGECLMMDDELRELIARRAPITTIKSAARERGTVLLRESAEALVREGRTSLEEINRVTFSR